MFPSGWIVNVGDPSVHQHQLINVICNLHTSFIYKQVTASSNSSISLDCTLGFCLCVLFQRANMLNWEQTILKELLRWVKTVQMSVSLSLQRWSSSQEHLRLLQTLKTCWFNLWALETNMFVGFFNSVLLVLSAAVWLCCFVFFDVLLDFLRMICCVG